MDGSNETDKEMTYFGLFDLDDGVYHMGKLVDLREASVMQFTGLLDKNGKEIYEGDILLYIKSKSKGKGQENKEERHYWLVSMSEYGQWIMTRGDVSQSVGHATKSHEVIGNTYQNPELIKRPAVD